MRICPNYARSSAGERRISWLQFTRQWHPKWSEVQTMLQRMIGAAMFNSATYEEIEADRNALGEAILVVVLVTVCGIVGGIIAGLIGGGGLGGLVRGIIVGLLFGIVRWALWVTVLNFVGGKMLRTSDTETNWSEIGRVLGYAYTPGVLSLLVFIPVVGVPLSLVGFVWTLAAVVVGARQALDFDNTGRAIAAVLLSSVVGFIPWIIVVAIQDFLTG